MLRLPNLLRKSGQNESAELHYSFAKCVSCSESCFAAFHHCLHYAISLSFCGYFVYVSQHSQRTSAAQWRCCIRKKLRNYPCTSVRTTCVGSFASIASFASICSSSKDSESYRSNHPLMEARKARKASKATDAPPILPTQPPTLPTQPPPYGS